MATLLTVLASGSAAAALPDVLGGSAPEEMPEQKPPAPAVSQVKAAPAAVDPPKAGLLDSLAVGIAAAGNVLGGVADAVGDAFATLAGWLAAFAGALGAAGDALGSALSSLGSLLAAGLQGLASLLTRIAGEAAELPGAIPEEARPLAIGAVAGGIGAAALALLAKLGMLAPLYSRLDPREILDNGVRQRIFEFIRQNPGAHATRIAKASGSGWGTTIYHLDRLQQARMVTRERGGNQACYFPSGFASHEARVAMTALKQATARQIADYVLAHPGASQKDVALALGLSQALVSWHVKRLAEAGVLQKLREGKSAVLSAAELAAPPAAAAA